MSQQKSPQTIKFTQELALSLGVSDPSQIKARNPAWMQLMKEGVLVDLHIGRWRGRSTLTWADLGIIVNKHEEKDLNEVINLGHKMLMPKDIIAEFDSVEGKARNWLKSPQISFRTYWGWFVPVNRYPTWKEKNDEFIREYFDIRDRVARFYDDIMSRVISDYRLAATDTYRRLLRMHPEMLGRFPSQDIFTSFFLDNVRRHMVTKEVFSASFYFQASLSYVPLPSLMADERAYAERVEAQRELERHAEQAEHDRIQAELRVAQSAEVWKRQLMQEMHRDVVSQAKQQKEKMVDGFFRDVVAQLRGMVYDVSTNVLARLRANNGSIPPSNIKQLHNMVDTIDKMPFSGDKDIVEMMKPVRKELNRIRNTDTMASQSDIEGVLTNIATVTRATLIGLGEENIRGGRELGIADIPTTDMVRSSRSSLGLPDLSEVDVDPFEREGGAVLDLSDLMNQRR